MLVRNYKHLCTVRNRHCFASSLCLKLLIWSPGVPWSGLGSMSENAASSDTLITANPNKQAVVNKIVEFLSEQMESDPEFEIYTTDIMDVFKNEFSDNAKKDAFQEGMVRLQETLATMGLQPEGHPITLVPDGALRNFFVSPMHLSYRSEDALKGAYSM